MASNLGDDCADPADTAAGAYQEEARGAEGELPQETRKTGEINAELRDPAVFFTKPDPVKH